MKSYRDGYRNTLHDRGVRAEGQSVWIREGRRPSGVLELSDRIVEDTGVKRCSLLADLAIVQYLWKTWSRGKECGELEERQIDMSSGVIQTRVDQDSTRRAKREDLDGWRIRVPGVSKPLAGRYGSIRISDWRRLPFSVCKSEAGRIQNRAIVIGCDEKTGAKALEGCRAVPRGNVAQLQKVSCAAYL